MEIANTCKCDCTKEIQRYICCSVGFLLLYMICKESQLLSVEFVGLLQGVHVKKTTNVLQDNT